MWSVLQVSAEMWTSAGDSRPRLSLSSGDSGDGEIKQEGSEHWGFTWRWAENSRLRPPAHPVCPGAGRWHQTRSFRVTDGGASGIPQGNVGNHQGHHKGGQKSTKDTT